MSNFNSPVLMSLRRQLALRQQARAQQERKVALRKVAGLVRADADEVWSPTGTATKVAASKAALIEIGREEFLVDLETGREYVALSLLDQEKSLREEAEKAHRKARAAERAALSEAVLARETARKAKNDFYRRKARSQR